MSAHRTEVTVGAAVVAVDGNFDDALRIVRELAGDEVALLLLG